MDNFTEEEKVEYERIVRHEYMVLLAKKEAALRLQQKEREETEKQNEILRKEQQERIEHFTDMAIRDAQCKMETLTDYKKQEVSAECSDRHMKLKDELHKMNATVNFYRKKAGLDPIDLAKVVGFS